MTPDDAIKFYSELKTAYQLTFGSAAGKTVMKDLTPFCRAKFTCFVPGDPCATAFAEGRRDVFLRIQDFLDLTPEQLVALNTKPAKER